MKKEFTVYFEICGKKMKTKIEADNKFDAESKLRAKLFVLKVDQMPGWDDILDGIKDIFKK